MMLLKYHNLIASKTHQKEKKMNWMTSKVKSFFSEEDGATAIEYGLIAGLISVVIIAALIIVGGNLNAVFTAIGTALGAIPGV